jgi:hypothetical protein
MIIASGRSSRSTPVGLPVPVASWQPSKLEFDVRCPGVFQKRISATQKSQGWQLIVQPLVFRRVAVQKGIVVTDRRRGHGRCRIGPNRNQPTSGVHSVNERYRQSQLLTGLELNVVSQVKQAHGNTPRIPDGDTSSSATYVIIQGASQFVNCPLVLTMHRRDWDARSEWSTVR